MASLSLEATPETQVISLANHIKTSHNNLEARTQTKASTSRDSQHNPVGAIHPTRATANPTQISRTNPMAPTTSLAKADTSTVVKAITKADTPANNQNLKPASSSG